MLIPTSIRLRLTLWYVLLLAVILAVFIASVYFVLRHKLNQKLRTEDDNTINDIQEAYSIFTEKPVITIKAYGENHIKIPILVLDEALPI